jgi:hypothetical protein
MTGLRKKLASYSSVNLRPLSLAISPSDLAGCNAFTDRAAMWFKRMQSVNGC